MPQVQRYLLCRCQMLVPEAGRCRMPDAGYQMLEARHAGCRMQELDARCWGQCQMSVPKYSAKPDARCRAPVPDRCWKPVPDAGCRMPSRNILQNLHLRSTVLNLSLVLLRISAPERIAVASTATFQCPGRTELSPAPSIHTRHLSSHKSTDSHAILYSLKFALHSLPPHFKLLTPHFTSYSVHSTLHTFCSTA